MAHVAFRFGNENDAMYVCSCYCFHNTTCPRERRERYVFIALDIGTRGYATAVHDCPYIDTNVSIVRTIWRVIDAGIYVCSRFMTQSVNTPGLGTKRLKPNTHGRA